MEEAHNRSNPSRPLRVFLCHSSGDKPAVRKLYRRLKGDGFAPWLDEEELLPGQDWQQEIPAAVRACDAVIICLSQKSVTKEGYLHREIREALYVEEEKPEGTIFIIPVRLEEVEVPKRLSQWQWANMFDEDGYHRLVRALTIRANAIGATIGINEPQPPQMPGRPSDADAGPRGAVPPQAPVEPPLQPRPKPKPPAAPVARPEPRTLVSAPGAGMVRVNPKDGLKYVWIPPGAFMMGCSPGDDECYDGEKPSRRVTITRGFWIGQTPVTVGAYKRFAGATGRQMPTAPNFNNGWTNENMPIVNVTWNDAQAYCGWMGGRLPTEAEWEYAARGGSTEARYGPIDEIAWYSSNSGGQTHDVAQKRPNGFRLHDVLGNVWEWVNDWYDDNYYQNSPSQDPQGPASGQYRVVRGGSCNYYPRVVRVSVRRGDFPVVWSPAFGLRCGREVE
jgi:formylglycine-generating enzyme required for sulfatase activity